MGHEPLVAEQCAEVLRIPVKRGATREIAYLEETRSPLFCLSPTAPQSRASVIMYCLPYSTTRRADSGNSGPVPMCDAAGIAGSGSPHGEGRKERTCPLWPETVEVWSESRPSPPHLCAARKVGRLISRAMHRLDPNVATLSVDVDVYQRACQLNRRPYVYSDSEIQRLLQTALSIPSPKAPLLSVSLYTMLVLAYCAGLRIKEVISLNLEDVHLQDETIEVSGNEILQILATPSGAGGDASSQALFCHAPASRRTHEPRAAWIGISSVDNATPSVERESCC